MTLNELIGALRGLHFTGRYADVPVRIEGCDCTGEADGVTAEWIGDEFVVLITRKDSDL